MIIKTDASTRDPLGKIITADGFSVASDGRMYGVTRSGGRRVLLLGVPQMPESFTGRVLAVLLHNGDELPVLAPRTLKLDQSALAVMLRGIPGTMRYIFHRSCGAVIYRIINGEVRFLVLHELSANVWSLPKGHMEAGETEEQTALREIAEESGLTVTLDPVFRSEISYFIPPVSEKTVVFFLAQSEEGEIKIKPDEITGFCWVDKKQAAGLLRHRHFGPLLDKAEERISCIQYSMQKHIQ